MWAIIGVIAVIGFSFSLYSMIAHKIERKNLIGPIMAMIGFASPILLAWFLIIPTAILVTSAVFNKILILNDYKEDQKVKKSK